MDPSNVKAYFRRAVASRNLERVGNNNKFDDALDDLKKVLELDSSHEQANEEIATVKRLSKLKPKAASCLALNMSRSLLHGSTDREKLSGVRGGLVLLGRVLLDSIGGLLGKRWYTEDDYEYY